ncbi:MAG: extracellular solute-binding protein [Opitutaceae bacterium]|nr:extracellular solute-binding protein [Opitutaceae bacterium]
MKYLFIVISVGLVAASALTFFSFSEKQNDRPVLRWMTGVNPVREKQAELFEQWMIDNGYPAVELRIEGPKKTQKNIVQGVSGVAGDIFDCYYGEINLFQSIGLLEDVTDAAEEMGFGLSETYAGVWSDLAIDGRQYGFPRCVDTFVCWANVEAFEKVGLSAPPAVWTLEEFERIGAQYVDLSNRPGEHQTVYFSTQWGLFATTTLLRSMGVDIYNETMTGSYLDKPEARELYATVYRWVNDLNLIPTAAESKALSSQSSRTDKGVIYLFSQGNFGLIFAGRYATLYFREIGPKKLSISEYPHKAYRNAISFARSSAVYKGSKHKDLAVYFLKFMASDVYNKEIAENPDGLPPSPKFAYGEAFSHPEEYPNEWGLHDQIRDVVNEIGISFSYSPYLQMSTLIRKERNAMDSFLADRISVEEALSELALSIETDMVRFTSESEKLKVKYAKQVQDQKEIERLRREGKMVPLYLITNPFYRRYYVDKGWSLPEG